MSEGLARADAVLRLAHAHWVSYDGCEAILLAIVLLAVASGFASAGKRLRTPIAVTRPGGITAGFMLVIWLLAIYAFGVAMSVYGLQLKQAYPGFAPAHVPVGMFTFVDASVTFIVILYLTRRWGWKVALASAVIGTAAAPMIFEFPFDLIIMTRTNPPIRLIRCCIGSFSSCGYSCGSSQRYRC